VWYDKIALLGKAEPFWAHHQELDEKRNVSLKNPAPACRRGGAGKYNQIYSIATRWPRKVSSKGTWMMRRPESNLAFA
jgi:hypothetical protein